MESYRVLYEFYRDRLKNYFSPVFDPVRFKKYEEKFGSLIDNLGKEGLPKKYRLQYYKDETIITLYTFITLDLLSSKIGQSELWGALFERAFKDQEVKDRLRNEAAKGWSLKLEFSLEPDFLIKKSIKEWVDYHPHPIMYVKEHFEQSVKKNRIEDPTMVDAALVSNSDQKSFIACECKFMSDISSETTYHYARNQIARNLDVGLSTHGVNYYFILVTPKIFYKTGYKFYGYKMLEYMSGNVDAFKRDLILQKNVDDEAIVNLSKRVGWVTWEDLVKKIFEFRTSASNIPFKELKEFYSERQLWTS
ncbi:MAG TPA: hypothetical protein PKV48_00475 [Thermodesulfobacteriota bacterium]|nr:hypothetical protein [Thermodesulfobacteriota bacterium]